MEPSPAVSDSVEASIDGGEALHLAAQQSPSRRTNPQPGDILHDPKGDVLLIVLRKDGTQLTMVRMQLEALTRTLSRRTSPRCSASYSWWTRISSRRQRPPSGCEPRCAATASHTLCSRVSWMIA